MQRGWDPAMKFLYIFLLVSLAAAKDLVTPELCSTDGIIKEKDPLKGVF